MRWNASRHVKRPSASNRGARHAWDYFLSPKWNDKTKDMEDETRSPKEMTYRFMDYWVWVMQYTNGDYEEIDGLVIADNVRRAKNATGRTDP